ncbi:MAG: ankyrin repeat domain-containing protein [Bacteroidales bacterium]
MKMLNRLLLRSLLPVFALLLSFSHLSSQSTDLELCNNFRIAAYDGDTTALLFFLNTSEVDVDCYVDDEVTALSYAVQQGHYRIAEILLSYGANPNGVDYRAHSPLILAIIQNQPEIAELLILYGAKTDWYDFGKIAPLIKSIQLDNPLMTDMLLHYGANPDITIERNTTALQVALLYGDHTSATLLLEAGANPDLTDRNGHTPLMTAAWQNDTFMANTLLGKDASPNLTSMTGWHPLGFAVAGSSTEMIQMLYPLTDNYNKRDVMRLAVARGQKASEKTLIGLGMRKQKLPLLTGYGMHTGLSFNSHDLMMKYALHASEARYGSHLAFGFSHRTGSRRVFFDYPGQDSVDYQMNGTRYLVFVDIRKRIFRFDASIIRVDMVLGFEPGYSWGSFKGSSQRPWSGFVPGAYAGIMLTRQPWHLSFSYHYADFHDKPIPQLRWELETGFTILKRKYQYTPKKLPNALANPDASSFSFSLNNQNQVM